MTEIKTAQAWGLFAHAKIGKRINPVASPHEILTPLSNERNTPVVIVHGLTEAEVHEAAALLAKSREVCRQAKTTNDGEYGYQCTATGYLYYAWDEPTTCPSCGRKVVVV